MKISKKIRSAYEECSYSEMLSIWDAYKTPSFEKVRIWNEIAGMAVIMGAYRVRVITKNTFMFTAGFEYPDTATGEIRFRYYTPSATYDVLAPC